MDQPKTPLKSGGTPPGETAPSVEPIDLAPPALPEEPAGAREHDVLTMPLEEDTDPLYLTADETPPLEEAAAEPEPEPTLEPEAEPEPAAVLEAGPDPAVESEPEPQSVPEPEIAAVPPEPGHAIPPSPPSPAPTPFTASPAHRPTGVIVLGVALVLALGVIVVLALRLYSLQTAVERADLARAKAAATLAQPVLIISAVYGSGQNYVDVTARVNDLFRNPGVEFTSKPQWLQADPTPGWNKALIITYEYKGQRHSFTTGEGGRVSLAGLADAAKN